MTGIKLCALLVIAGSLALPGVSSAAQIPPPTQDSVVLTGGPAVANQHTVSTLNATSGPSGENPTGQLAFLVRAPFADFYLDGPVTCLAVSGNVATINLRPQTGPFSGFITTVQVVDDQPDRIDSIPMGRDPTDCSPLPFPTTYGGPLSSGDITIVDAQPPPTTKSQCRNGGWRQFGFANQGQCIAFVI